MVAEAMKKKEAHREWLERVDNLFAALESVRLEKFLQKKG